MVVGSLSAFTAVLYFIPFIIRFRAVLVWNVILFILWIAVFGLFGNVRLFPSLSRADWRAVAVVKRS